MRNSIKLALIGVALLANPAMAPAATQAIADPAVGTAAVAPVASDADAYTMIGEAPTAEEMDQRGGHVLVIVVGGVVFAARWCASNFACKTAATTLLKTLAQKGAQAFWAANEAELKPKLCQAGIRGYC